MMKSRFASMLKLSVVPAAFSLTFFAGFVGEGGLRTQAQTAPAPAPAATATPAAPKPGQSTVMVQPNTGGVTVVRPETATVQANGFSQYRGVTSIDTAATQMSLNRVVLPPGSSGPRNMHKNAESMVMVYQGTLTALIGEKGDQKVAVKAGEFLFVPGNVWHQWTNAGTEPAAIVETRADSNPANNLLIIPTP